jgi:hypothetical protein
MYRIRLATGHETVFETVEDIARGVSTGTITPECAIFHAKAGKWLPITVHPLYKQALAVAEEMAARPARPRRISRPLPRVDTPSPERTAPASTRVIGPDLESRGAPPPVEEPSPAAHELPVARSSAVAVDAEDELADAPSSAAAEDDVEDESVDEEAQTAAAAPPKLNDGLLDLGPIASPKAPRAQHLIIERGTPAPDADMPVTSPPAEARKTTPERTRRAEPTTLPAKVEPAPSLKIDPPVPEQNLDGGPNAGDVAGDVEESDAPYKVPDGKLLKRADGPLPIGAALGDFDDESKVDATLPPRSRDPGRRASGAQPAISAEQSGPYPRPRRDPFGHSARKGTGTKTPLIAAGFVGLIAVGWLLKSFVFAGGTDSAEAATRNTMNATLAAESATSQSPAQSPLALDSLNDSAVVAAVLDSLRRAAASESIPAPIIETPTISEYAAAYQSARTELDISLAAVDVPAMLGSNRWNTGEGARATQLDVRTIRRALAAFRSRESQVEGLRAEGELSLKETTPQVRRADLMLSALDSLFGWMVSQAGQYVMVDDAIVFRGEASQAETYRALKQRVLDEVYRPEGAPPSVTRIVQAMDSTLFPTATSIPSAPSLPTFSLPADTGSND